jgi:hypothetical protein
MIDKPDGRYTCQGLTQSLFTYQEQKWFNPTPFPDDQIMELTNKWKKKTRLYLPDNLFINLLNAELQEQILNGKGLDLDVKNAIKTLMEQEPTNLKNNLQDWKIKKIDG